MLHTLKIKEQFYRKIFLKEKTFEIRMNDRDFKNGDTIEFIVLQYIDGEEIKSKGSLILLITDVYRNMGYGLELGYCILSFKIISDGKSEEDKVSEENT